jgi:hypothetical protein
MILRKMMRGGLFAEGGTRWWRGDRRGMGKALTIFKKNGEKNGL